ncbi:hypothetical protein D9M71_51220 [compost metagenome]
MVAQGRACRGLAADDIQDARWQAQGVGDMAVYLLDQWGHFRWLEHHGAAGGQRRCQFPGAGHQGEVPWHDQANHAQRLHAHVGIEARYGQRHVAVLLSRQLFGQARVIVEGGDGIVDVQGRFVTGLAVVLHLQCDQAFTTLLDLLGEAAQIGSTFRCSRVAPGRQGLARRSDGLIDLFDTRAAQFGKGQALGWIINGDLFGTVAVHPMPVDVMRRVHGCTCARTPPTALRKIWL